MSDLVRPDHGSTTEGLRLAERLLAAGQLAQAEAACREVLSSHPRSAPALHLLGLIAHRAGAAATAIDLVRQAIAADGRVGAYHANLCEMCRQAGRTLEALDAGRQAVALDPRSATALNNLGIVHYERADYTEAAAHYRRALAEAPNFAQAHSNLGNALRAQHRFEEALPCYRRALEIEPAFADAWSNLGSTLNILGRRDEGIEAYRSAVASDPLHGNGHTGMALQLLLRGRFDEGWHEYEWRWRSSEIGARRFTGRGWQGDDIAGRRILIHAEQGLGDTLQFCRYAALIRERGAEVVLCVPSALKRLLAFSLPEITVIGEDEPAPPHDVQASMMSLPLLLGLAEAPIQAAVPYLSAKPSEVAEWRAFIGAKDRIAVGIAWAGNPAHINDHNRSIAAATLAPLLAVKGVRWVSLQVGGAKPPPAGLLDASLRIGDFLDTAGAIEALDLVICIDSAVAHLAGALGRPTWVMLPVGCDWRWRLEGEESAWYPTLRLFRQAAYGLWAPAVKRIAGELRTLVRRRA